MWFIVVLFGVVICLVRVVVVVLKTLLFIVLEDDNHGPVCVLNYVVDFVVDV
jgi:hypothetical protein